MVDVCENDTGRRVIYIAGYACMNMIDKFNVYF